LQIFDFDLPANGARGRGTTVVLAFSVIAKNDDDLLIEIDRSRCFAGEAEGGPDGLTKSRYQKFFELGAPRRARGYFGAADRLRDFEFLQSASVPFPGQPLAG
jgi:hypothetical protein